jgi:CheY-like chemotaxis protein
MRILVVDDCRDAADSLSLLLCHCGHEAQAVYDGQAALQVATAFLPELVFLDLGLPRIDGFEVAEQVRAARHPSNCVIVACTGFPSYRERALQAGFFDYLLKPASFDQLRETMDRAQIHLQEMRKWRPAKSRKS